MPPWAGEALPRSVRMTQDEEEQREGGGAFKELMGRAVVTRDGQSAGQQMLPGLPRSTLSSATENL